MFVYPIFMLLGGCSAPIDTDLSTELLPPAEDDTERPDTSSADSDDTETATPDTAALDTAATDTAAADTAEIDTAVPDTAAPDTAAPDTAELDTAVPDTAASDPDEDLATEADALFVEGTIHHFELTLDAAAIASLTADPDLDVPASFSYGGDTFEVGVHIKGSHSLRTLAEKASFKIDFDEFTPDQRFLGLEHLTLNNMVQDRSMLREHAAYWLYEQLGVPASRHGYARVEVNGTLYGLYGIVESMDQDFLARRFPDDTEGNLYETVHARGDVTEDGVSSFELQNAGDAPEGEDLEELVETLEAATPDTFYEVLGSVFDTDQLLTFLALDIVMGHDDGYVTSNNNFLLYNAPEAGEWHLVPWGQDQTFDEDSVLHVGYEGQLAARCVTSPACKLAFDAKLREVADLWESADLAGYVEEAHAAIVADCEADPRKEHACSANSLLDFIDWRPTSVRAQLP
jgi:hypothetical protein